ncbi:hypothetical protein CC86DRAFT_420308 [Ophiobolus disseminans]|uniref:Ubiquitin-like protease family profile domain-containing protein n=1 Tax=Ophiobolus disseminans TaxID=1469910 RepID=A0A6A6ZX74_9PLEO|nr:hypothetical protein CC86DRAFT_420308 [Ophiobolus disseminans]
MSHSDSPMDSPMDPPAVTSTTPPTDDSTMVDIPTIEPESTAAPNAQSKLSRAMSTHPSRAECEASTKALLQGILSAHCAPVMSTTPPNEDLPMGDGPTQLLSSVFSPAEETSTAERPALPTPSTSSASEKAPSPTAADKWTRVDKTAHYKRARIFPQTHQKLGHQTTKMLVTASRGYERAAYLPTRATMPPLLKRRYSVDVVTKNCGEPFRGGWKAEHIQMPDTPYCYDEADPVIQRARAVPLPNPSRYRDFMIREAELPPDTDDVYLYTDNQLKNHNFLRILQTWGDAAWMEDEGLNMSLEALSKDKKCHNYHIDILSTNIAQVIHMTTMLNDAHETYYEAYRQRLNAMRWIFIPINNGISGEEPETISSGTHWSLVIMDRVHKTGFYYDSLNVSERWPSQIQQIGQIVSKGLLMVLGENLNEWTWSPQEYSPRQWINNQFSNDSGPCGPFVWKMCSDMIDTIIDFQNASKEGQCNLKLDWRFPSKFEKRFHSYYVRQEMYFLVANYKCLVDPVRLIEEHDQAAVKNEVVVLSDVLPVTIKTTEWQREQRRRAEVALEQELEAARRAALEEDDSNFMVISRDTDDYDSEASTVASNPAEPIILDEPSETEETPADLGDVFHAASPRLHHTVEHHSHNSPALGDEGLWGLDGSLDNGRTTSPTADRIRPTTPETTGAGFEYHPGTEKFSFISSYSPEPPTSRHRSPSLDLVGDDEAVDVQADVDWSHVLRHAPRRPPKGRPTTPENDFADDEYDPQVSSRRRHHRRDSDTWSTKADHN